MYNVCYIFPLIFLSETPCHCPYILYSLNLIKKKQRAYISKFNEHYIKMSFFSHPIYIQWCAEAVSQGLARFHC